MSDPVKRKPFSRIWLQYPLDEDGYLEPTDEATWCQDQIDDADIEYRLASDYTRVEAERDEARAALEAAVEVIRTWHNFPGETNASVWPIYYAHSPEMGPIRKVLGAAPGEPEGKP